LPVIFVPSPALEGARKQLPYAATWLDYCEIAFLAPEAAAKSAGAMRLLLDQLANISADEAATRREALLRVRDAFVARPPQARGARRPETRHPETGHPETGHPETGRGGGESDASGTEATAQSSMANFLVREACEVARRERPPVPVAASARRRRRPAAGAGTTAESISRCMLGGINRE
jgi:hypothetical protein